MCTFNEQESTGTTVLESPCFSAHGPCQRDLASLGCSLPSSPKCGDNTWCEEHGGRREAFPSAPALPGNSSVKQQKKKQCQGAS